MLVVPLSVGNFDGGWNTRSSPAEIGSNESPDLLNVTLDERGAATKRLGSARLNASARASAVDNFYYSKVLDKFLIQRGTTLEVTSDFVTFTAATPYTASTSARGAWTDFNDEVVWVHPVDGVYTTANGVLYTSRSSTAKGTCVEVWENKVWTGDGETLWWSNAGDSHTWTTATDFNKIRENGSSALTALKAGPGGLTLWKRRGFGYVTNSVTGSYLWFSNDAGAASSLAVVQNGHRIAAICDNGIWVTDGATAPIRVSDKIAPLFRQSQLAMSHLDLMCAGIKQDRFTFSLTRTGGSVNNLTLEYQPDVGWVVPHSWGISAFTTYTKNAAKSYGAKASAGYLLDLFSGWDDEGSAIASRFQSASFNLGTNSRLHKLRTTARGVFDLYVLPDYMQGGVQLPVSLATSGANWDTARWDSSVWGETLLAGFQDDYSVGVGKTVSFKIVESSSTQASDLAFLGDGVAEDIGAWALYGLDLETIPLGRS